MRHYRMLISQMYLGQDQEIDSTMADGVSCGLRKESEGTGAAPEPDRTPCTNGR